MVFEAFGDGSGKSIGACEDCDGDEDGEDDEANDGNVKRRTLSRDGLAYVIGGTEFFFDVEFGGVGVVDGAIVDGGANGRSSKFGRTERTKRFGVVLLRPRMDWRGRPRKPNGTSLVWRRSMSRPGSRKRLRSKFKLRVMRTILALN